MAQRFETLKSIEFSWIIVMVLLFITAFYDYLENGSISVFAWIFVTAIISYFAANYYLKRTAKK